MCLAHFCARFNFADAALVGNETSERDLIQLYPIRPIPSEQSYGSDINCIFKRWREVVEELHRVQEQIPIVRKGL